MNTPFYLLEEKLLRNNLSIIRHIATQTQVEIILAFKAFALWKTFPIIREYIHHTTASSLYEARLGYEEFGSKCHTYSPAYEDYTFDELVSYSSHLTFNSLSQYTQFYERAKDKVTCGIRINPEYSEIETDLYNPCALGSRFGVLSSQLNKKLPDGIEGFHCHSHCESNSYALERSLQHIERKFGKWLPSIQWINLGGGHLVTRENYDVEHLIKILNQFSEKYPQLKIILEPGSAFAWYTGSLYASVVDIVENKGIKTAILNVSFTCHMPDCLEMPYYPTIPNAIHIDEKELTAEELTNPYIYRLGGNSCLSGDYLGVWKMDHELNIGDTIEFKDMMHYTTVKTNMFNGIHHPSIAIKHLDKKIEVLKEYNYCDYKNRMD